MSQQTSPQQTTQASAAATLPASAAALPPYSDAEAIRLCEELGVRLTESSTGWDYQIPTSNGHYDGCEASYETHAQAAQAAAAIFRQKELNWDYQCLIADLSEADAVSICKNNGVELIDTPPGWDWACGSVISEFSFEELDCAARHAIFILKLEVPVPQ